MLGLKTYYEYELRNFTAVENDYKDVTVFAENSQRQEVYNFLNDLRVEGWEMAQTTDTDGNLFWVCNDEGGNVFTVFTGISAEDSEIWV